MEATTFSTYIPITNPTPNLYSILPHDTNLIQEKQFDKYHYVNINLRTNSNKAEWMYYMPEEGLYSQNM